MKLTLCSCHAVTLLGFLSVFSSCGLGRKTKYHCDTQTLRRFELEKKSVDGTTATLRLKGQQGQKVEGKDGRSDDDCHDAGVQDQPLTLASGLKVKAYVCHKPPTGEYHWNEVDARSDVDDIVVTDGDWLILDELHYAENASSGRSGIPGSVVRTDAAAGTVYTTALPSDLDSYGTCGAHVKQMTNNTFYATTIVPLDLHD